MRTGESCGRYAEIPIASLLLILPECAWRSCTLRSKTISLPALRSTSLAIPGRLESPCRKRIGRAWQPSAIPLGRADLHFDLPKPLHGWREFAGEVGIIVIGVLIALSAEQVVQDLQTRADEKAFRETIDHEIGLNLFMYDVRARQFACDEKRVKELKSW